MNKVAILIVADTESHEGLGRVVNGFEIAKECQEAGDDVRIIFDGGGTTWVPELADKDNQLNPLYEAVKDNIVGACDFCAQAFGVKDKIETIESVPLLNEYDNHPSIRKHIQDGFQIITF